MIVGIIAALGIAVALSYTGDADPATKIITLGVLTGCIGLVTIGFVL